MDRQRRWAQWHASCRFYRSLVNTPASQRLTGVSLVLVMACAFLTAPALDARAQSGPADPMVPTAIEEALIEHACGSLRPAGTLENEAYLGCRNRQLLALRTDFGRDLRRLLPGQRRTIDMACSGLRASQGQDVYIECVTARLSSLRGHGNPPPTELVAGSAVAEQVALVVPSPPPTPPSSRGAAVWIGTGLVAVMVVFAGGAFVVRNPRRRYGGCRTCGVKLLERGDLCQTCRHEAANALRRATAERADHARVQEDEQRRQAAREVEQQQLAIEDEARRQQHEEAQKEQTRGEEARVLRQRDDEARQQRQIDVSATEDEFDPYAVLGLPQGASSVDVDAAYKTVRSKFDLDLVADMGVELQEHMKRKAEAVERAYETLSAAKSRT
jgi:hypothetical protein